VGERKRKKTKPKDKICEINSTAKGGKSGIQAGRKGAKNGNGKNLQKRNKKEERKK